MSRMNIIKTVSIGLLLLWVPSCAAKSSPEPEKLVENTTEETTEEASNQVEEPAEKADTVEPTKEVAKSDVEDTPTEIIKKYTEELKSLVKPNEAKTDRNREGEKEIAEKVRQFFDFPGLARMSLGSHWRTISSRQKKEFSSLFITLIEDSYLRRSRDIVGDYDVTYKKEEVNGKRSKVFSQVARDDADVEILYELHRNPKNWMIYNIVLDGVDLIRNYQSQFNRIISQGSFEDLLKKMRKKRVEIDKENSK